MVRIGFVLPSLPLDHPAGPAQAVRNLVLAGHGAWFVISSRSSAVSVPEGVAPVVLLALFASILAFLPLLAGRSLRTRRSEREIGHSLYLVFWLLVVSLTIVTFTFSNLPDGVTSWRWVVPVYFGLAWLVVPISASAVRATQAVAVLAALYCAANLVTLISWNPVNFRTPPPPEVTTWLKARGLRTGYASYVDAHVLTHDSDGAMAVRPVLEGASCRSSEPGAICPYLYTTAASWFSGQASGPTFLVVHPADPGVDMVTASPAPRLGVPLEKVVIGSWQIVVYADDIAARFLPGVSVPGQPPAHG
jgi:hypothetical protein